MMMVKKRKGPRAKQAPQNKIPIRSVDRQHKSTKHTITPKERWLLIAESARTRVQKRGFIGGDPVQDWLAAEREIDAHYRTDYESMFSKTDVSEIVEQIRGAFSGPGLPSPDLEAFIDKQRGTLKTLARINRELIDGTSEFANQQTALLQESVSTTVNTLKSLSHGELDTEGVTKQADLAMQAMSNVFSRVRTLADFVGNTTAPVEHAASSADTSKAAPKSRTRKKPQAKTGTKAKAKAKAKSEAKTKTRAKRR